jgi:LuxR family maltose regulon positive regulatory protein
VIAGRGYGKTVEVAAFAMNADERLVWMHINELDCVPDHFWISFTRATEEEFPNLGRCFESLGYPDTPAKFDSFVHMFAGEIYSGPRVLFVVDDYGLVSESEIKLFFENIIRENLDNFCLIIISSAKIGIGEHGLWVNGLFQITADDLRFTLDETHALFSMYGHEIDDDRLREIDSRTEGWPAVLYLLSQGFDPDRSYDVPNARLHIINSMFEREFFLSFSFPMRKLLVKLSLVRSFSFDLVKEIGGCDIDEAWAAVRANMFIAYDVSSGLYTFQHVYGDFLADRQYMLSDGERRELWQKSGEVFLSAGYSLEAIECFNRIGMYDRMLAAIAKYSRRNPTYSRGRANYLLEKIEPLPPEFVEQNPLASCIKAVIYINIAEFDRAYEILLETDAVLSSSPTPEDRILRGEVCLMMGGINMLRMRTVFVDFFKRASECLPDGVSVGWARPWTGNGGIFMMEDNLTGALERMEAAVREAVPHLVRAARGDGGGLDCLFSAEARYMTLDLDSAKRSALEAMYATAGAGQHETLCCARLLLAQIALMRGDYGGFGGQVEYVRDYIDERGLRDLYELRDCAMAWMYLTVGDSDRIAGWIVQHDTAESGGREMVVLAGYLLDRGKYNELLALLSHMEKFFENRGGWRSLNKTFILSAGAYMRLGDAPAALSAFWRAYDMSYANGILAPFVEEAAISRGMSKAVRANGGSRFDGEWLDDIRRKSIIHARKLTSVAREYRKRGEVSAASGRNGGIVKLSRRELEILNGLSLGMTRDEIANINGLSINTVKSVISSLYNKLGAVNGADAVRIATSLKILNIE